MNVSVHNIKKISINTNISKVEDREYTVTEITGVDVNGNKTTVFLFGEDKNTYIRTAVGERHA